MQTGKLVMPDVIHFPHYVLWLMSTPLSAPWQIFGLLYFAVIGAASEEGGCQSLKYAPGKLRTSQLEEMMTKEELEEEQRSVCGKGFPPLLYAPLFLSSPLLSLCVDVESLWGPSHLTWALGIWPGCSARMDSVWLWRPIRSAFKVREDKGFG